MRMISAFFGAALLFLCGAAVAQTGPEPAQTGNPPAPKGHLQPKPLIPPIVPNKKSADATARHDPAALEQRLKQSNDAAIRSLCAFCLKPLAKDQPEPR